MTGKPEIEQEWSVYAHLTFSHGGSQLGNAAPPTCVRHQVPLHPCYGFQRGNILFTTKPPTERATYGSLPTRRTPQPYNRRCMSTCNIVLAQDNNNPVPPRCHHTVTLSCDEPLSHSQHPEICEICSGGGRSPTAARRAHTFTSHFCTRVPDKTSGSKDVASQTSQIFSPPPPPESQHTNKKDGSPSKQKDHLNVPSPSQGSGNDKPSKGGRRLSRSPARLRGKSPLLNKASTDNKKKPRTVHIDVYCTGSDASGSSDAEETSTPQTVYESEKVRVVHTREDERLPQALCRQKRRTLSESSSSRSSLYRNTETMSDVTTDISSLYPSQRSSVASVLDAGSSMQSDSLASNMSSSCGIFSDESGPATSWKDTSDVESVRQSDISLTKSESFEYADYADRLRILEKEKAWGTGQKTWRSPEVERKHHLQQLKCQQYIERRDSPFPKWKPNDEDDNEDDDKGTKDNSKGSKTTTSSSSEDVSCESEMAWSFGRIQDVHDSKGRAVKREDTVRRAGKSMESSSNKMFDSVETKGNCELKNIYESGSLSDSTQSSLHRYATRDCIGPFGKEVIKPKSKLESSVTTPFTSVPGKKTDQLSKAEKFGTIIGAFRKPGHHVGPSKNPDCSCENCRHFYEERGYRTRARSMGDMPSSQNREKWKATLHGLVQNKLTEDSGSSEWDVGSLV